MRRSLMGRSLMRRSPRAGWSDPAHGDPRGPAL